MDNQDKMICPACSAEMNFHALKIDYSESPDNVALPQDWGGVLEEFHSCLHCGITSAREHVVGA